MFTKAIISKQYEMLIALKALNIIKNQNKTSNTNRISIKTILKESD